MDKDLWNSLSQYETFDLVQRQFSKSHDRELNESRTWEIMSCFIQARQYFASSEEASESVRPLLLYYGVLAISRGLILFLDPLTREATLKAGHGLKTGNWEETLAGGIHKVLDLQLSAEAGTFAELAKAVKETLVQRHTTLDRGAILTWERQYPDHEAIQGISLRDIASRIPSLSRIYRDVTEEQPNCVLGSILETQQAFAVRIARDPIFGFESAGLVRSKFEVPDDIPIHGALPSEDFSLSSFQFSFSRASFPSLLPPLIEYPEGSEEYGYVVAPWKALHIPPLLRTYLASYLLGMLVRYFPSRWMALVRNEKGDAALPLIRALADHIETEFPRYALETIGS